MANLKLGTVIKGSQIVTISKMRVLNPINKKSLLYKIKLTDEDMALIDEHLKNLYFK